jgi:hypothetical protein
MPIPLKKLKKADGLSVKLLSVMVMIPARTTLSAEEAVTDVGRFKTARITRKRRQTCRRFLCRSLSE